MLFSIPIPFQPPDNRLYHNIKPLVRFILFSLYLIPYIIFIYGLYLSFWPVTSFGI